MKKIMFIISQILTTRQVSLLSTLFYANFKIKKREKNKFNLINNNALVRPKSK